MQLPNSSRVRRGSDSGQGRYPQASLSATPSRDRRLATDGLRKRREVGYPVARGLVDPRGDLDRSREVAREVTPVDRLVVRCPVAYKEQVLQVSIDLTLLLPFVGWPYRERGVQRWCVQSVVR